MQAVQLYASTVAKGQAAGLQKRLDEKLQQQSWHHEPADELQEAEAMEVERSSSQSLGSADGEPAAEEEPDLLQADVKMELAKKLRELQTLKDSFLQLLLLYIFNIIFVHIFCF